MPELPEVETIKNELARKILNKKIVQVDVEKSFTKKIFPTPEKFRRMLKGKTFNKINRRAKLLIIGFGKQHLLIHLKLTGQLVYALKPDIESLSGKFVRVVFRFTDGSALYFNDLRKFGYLKILGKSDLTKELEKYGVEPLSAEFKLKEWDKILERRPNKKIKIVLLDQEAVAGIGNIYSDEACFHAGVRPLRIVKSLSESEKRRLFHSIKKVLNLGIKHHGVSVDQYVRSTGKRGNFQNLLKVYGRKGEQCKKCGNKISSLKIGGRTSCFCPRCQK